MGWVGHVARMGEMRKRTIFWSENLTGRDHSDDRRRWEDNIRIDLREKWWEAVEWIRLAQDRDQWRALVDTVIIF